MHVSYRVKMNSTRDNRRTEVIFNTYTATDINPRSMEGGKKLHKHSALKAALFLYRSFIKINDRSDRHQSI